MIIVYYFAIVTQINIYRWWAVHTYWFNLYMLNVTKVGSSSIRGLVHIKEQLVSVVKTHKMRSILTVNLVRPCNAYSQSSCFSFVLVYSCFHKLLFRESLIISHSQNKTNTQLLVRTLLIGFKIIINHLSREDRNTQYFHFISQNSFLCHGPVPVCNSSCIRLKRGRWGRELCVRRGYCVFYIDRFRCIR